MNYVQPIKVRLNAQSSLANELQSLFTCWIAWIDHRPGFDQSFWQLLQPAALYPSTLIITIFLISSATQVTVDKGHCKDVLTYSIQRQRKSAQKTKKWKIKNVSFCFHLTHLDTPLDHLRVHRKLGQCCLQTLLGSISPGRTLSMFQGKEG